ncbi:hypothetical protein TRFO_14374 [Tritrichomonas foetus]|uniref:Importin N-terminal domain-containing protein n=1 Tax=Tritrichomonas foetus TaxID=1144522 RepID=A0A1J4KVL5_9EUKA|nr:hypothetical protein TRFO_14374 [Tritrichomonas foetus]|eukprot:OHT15186.1 hypothetical protein TRFO_14374 [Tritrichomonas foetus]
MINSLIENFGLTFRSTGNQANIQIQNSCNELSSLKSHPDFFPSLFLIIQTTTYPDEIRMSALNYLYHSIDEWSVNISPQAKQYILENLPLLLNNSSQYFLTAILISTKLINCCYFCGEWPNLNDFIASSISSKNENVVSSIILLNSISRHFKGRFDDNVHSYESIYPYLIDFILTSNSFALNGLTFQTLRFFNDCSLSLFLRENNNLLGNLMIYIATTIANFHDIHEFLYFVKKAMKFCASMIRKYPEVIIEQIAIQLVNAQMSFFENCKNENILSSISNLMNAFLNYQPTHNYISLQFHIYINKMIAPFYFLNSQDIVDSMNDPSQFLAKFQTWNFVYQSECRAYLYETMKCLSKKSINCCISTYKLFQGIISNYFCKTEHNEPENALLFSYLLIFSAFLPELPLKMNELFEPIIDLFSKLISSPSHLVVSGSLIVFKNLVTFEIPEYLYSRVVQLLISHPSMLVRYYAATAFSAFLQANKTREQNYLNIVQSCMPVIGNVINSYIELSSEYHDIEFTEFISNILEFFGAELIVLSPSFVQNIFSIFMQYQSMEYSCTGSILTSLSEFIQGIGSNNINIDGVIFPIIMEILQSMELFGEEVTISLFMFLVDLLETPLNHTLELYWKLYEIIPHIIETKSFNVVENALLFMRKLLLKDRTTGINERIIHFTIHTCIVVLKELSPNQDYELCAVILLLSTVFQLCPPQTIFINNINNLFSLYRDLILNMKTWNENSEILEYSLLLFLTMMLQNHQIVIQILGNDFLPFCNEWMELSLSATLQMLFTYSYHKFFPQDILSEFINKSLNSFENENDPLNDDEYDDTFNLFDKDEIFQNFRNFLSLISESNQELATILLEKFDEQYQNYITKHQR